MNKLIKLVSYKQVVVLAYPLLLLMTAMWCIWNLAIFSWLMMGTSDVESGINTKTQHQQLKPTEVNGYTIRSISNLNLFGRVKSGSGVTTEPQLANIRAAETQLKLTLMGVRHSSGTIKSSAIIAGSNKKQNIYYIGDSLPIGDAKVEEIFIQHIMISRQGEYETLTLFSVLNAKPVSNEITHIEKVTDLTGSSFVTRKLNKYKAIAMKDPIALSRVVNFAPVTDGKQFVGYKLSPGMDSAFFRKAGLRRGDVLTAINGVKLDSPNQVLSLMADLTLANELALTVDRGGEPLSFTYSF